MTKITGYHAVDRRDDAEGSPDAYEQEEPRSPLRTSSFPVIKDRRLPSASETGLIPMMDFKAEGDDNSEGQDASLTQDDSKLDTQSDADTNHMSDVAKDTPVLIVEDTVELAEVIQATLESMGMTAEYATHGKTGLEKLEDLNPGLIILDIGLPDISGWKMLDGIKAHFEGNGQDMPIIIVVTAYGDPANRLIGKLQNIYTYLIKPLTPDQIERVVQQALRGEKPDEPSIDG